MQPRDVWPICCDRGRMLAKTPPMAKPWVYNKFLPHIWPIQVLFHIKKAIITVRIRIIAQICTLPQCSQIHWDVSLGITPIGISNFVILFLASDILIFSGSNSLKSNDLISLRSVYASQEIILPDNILLGIFLFRKNVSSWGFSSIVIRFILCNNFSEIAAAFGKFLIIWCI